VLRAIAALEPAPTRDVSRRTGIPVPLIAAVSNELRSRGVLDNGRPARLTDLGRRLVGDLAAVAAVNATCHRCGGSTIVVPPSLAPTAERLDALILQTPQVDVSLDQSHSTADTKLRRVLHLMRTDALPAESVLFVGDDDLMSLTVALVGAALGTPLARRLVVLDNHEPMLAFLRANLDDAGVENEVVRHDLRDPIPAHLEREFDVAVTDPPYTVEGGLLFVSRAVEGLRQRPSCDLLLSFGPKGPDDALAIQRTLAELNLAVLTLLRNFNAYLGADVLGGTSHLYHLTTTRSTAPVVTGSYEGDLYTADKRAAARAYVCLSCRSRFTVGPGQQWGQIGQLREAGCPTCGEHRFRPLTLVRNGDGAQGSTA
jgi:predicted methyltransferase/DNA-directed RNA polymerase subunit RPC12/RpoP